MNTRRLQELKTGTIQNKLKKANKDIERFHTSGHYDKLDNVLLLKNQLEVELEARGVYY
ncbi:hypothetical protein YN120080_199 [Staphylococcus phage vB_SauM_JDYN]|nr:hypothetical protein YN120080_199 [Staphylococcus phage vB_SauM_JDYN]